MAPLSHFPPGHAGSEQSSLPLVFSWVAVLTSQPPRYPPLNPVSDADRAAARRIVRTAFFSGGAIFAFIIWQLYLRPPATSVPEWTASLPAMNAAFNATTTTLICLGVLAIKNGRRRLHIGFQIAALVSAALFLVGYLTYHHFQGDTPYPGTGFLRPIYFFCLITHVLASAVSVPLILATVSFAATRRFSAFTAAGRGLRSPSGCTRR